ncbi:MAG: LTA synthase family protein, partial [Myxococcota bacterium]|nr:LTA synthase family protein [Myxococcota bacterium]
MPLFQRPATPACKAAAGATLLWASLILLRQDTLQHLELTTAEAFVSGLGWGWYFDAVILVVPALLASLATQIHPRLPRWVVLGGSAFIWLAAVANTLYVRFFDTPLNWWVVKLHWRDIFVIHDSATELSVSWMLPGSFALAACALIINARAYRPNNASASRWWRAAHTLGLALALLVLWRGPAWMHVRDNNPLLRDNIVRAWAVQTSRSRLFQGVSTEWLKELDGAESGDPTLVLSAYRTGQPQKPPPLYREIPSAPEHTHALRAQLGLPEKGPVHVFLLFAESLRTYELDHPTIGPAIFPNLRRRLQKNGVYFSQAYSSSFTAGQTVRGQFSTLCSMLPNIAGAATYIAHTSLRVTCIQEFLRQHGYTTAWLNSFQSSYHNKRLFETLHGTEHFFDGDYFRAQGVTQRVGSWGLADGPFLLETLKTLERLAHQNASIFANILTISTHHPQTVIPEGPVPAPLLKALNADESYHGLLSRYAYLDRALEDFFEALFTSSLGDNSLVVLLGDHGTPHTPPDTQNAIQNHEARFRIPIALLSRHTRPLKLDHPVHQMDIAPTIARVAGASARAAWMGRGLFESPASPWVYQEGGHTSYRAGDRACYHLSPHQGGPLTCVDTSA